MAWTLLRSAIHHSKLTVVLKEFHAAVYFFPFAKACKNSFHHSPISSMAKQTPPTDPEVHMTIREIIAYHGYPFEEYDVTTKDGYILTIHRIPHGLKDSESSPRKPVIVQHGLLCSSAVWVLNTPDKNLAYMLANEGFDVWLTNIRGNHFGRRHTTLDPNEKEFWNFSVDQMIAFDMPALIDFILQKTGFDQLHYIGHSMGCSIPLGLLSTQLEYNKKIREIIALAPASALAHTTSPVRIFSQFGKHSFRDLFGDKEMMDEKLRKFMSKWPFARDMCSSVLFFLTGETRKNINMDRFPIYLGHVPAGTSAQNLIHLIQLIKSKKFLQYDYGSKENLLHYSQSDPPEYDLTKVTTPVAVFSGDADILVHPKDADLLASKMKNLILNCNIPKYTHMDFMWAANANSVLYPKIIELLKSERS